MRYPALDVHGADPDMVLAVVDDFAPSAVEDLADGVSVFFFTAAGRDDALAVLANALPHATLSPRDVDDEDWARRSQANLTPIVVGRIVVTPPWLVGSAGVSAREPDAITIVIAPSMGFGTGHHATTRLCLGALQRLEVNGRRVLDLGTGSGVLAIAAARLGAREALGIDVDPDAIAAARDNLPFNPEAGVVRFEVVDFRKPVLAQADIVLANLTGAVLIDNAALLLSAVAPGGALILSGIQAGEQQDVSAAFSGGRLFWSDEEAGWVALGFNLPTAPHV
jgi:ribosomal protein L11 methyltransferase